MRARFRNWEACLRFSRHWLDFQLRSSVESPSRPFRQYLRGGRADCDPFPPGRRLDRLSLPCQATKLFSFFRLSWPYIEMHADDESGFAGPVCLKDVGQRIERRVSIYFVSFVVVHLI